MGSPLQRSALVLAGLIMRRNAAWSIWAIVVFSVKDLRPAPHPYDPRVSTEYEHPLQSLTEPAVINQVDQADGVTPPSPSLTPSEVTIETRSGQKRVPVTNNFFTSFATAFGMIIFSELGDKTFLIAAIMAMRNSRTRVFLATSLALTLMTVISVLAGRIIPALVSQQFTKWIAAMLLLVFGLMMVKEGLAMAPDHLKEEYDEVVHEIEGERVFSCSADALEAQSPIETSESRNTTELLAARINDLFGGSLNPVAVQVFSMVFLAEWGDRSQLATIVLAAAQNPWGVALGASTGHAVCSLIAVLVGRAMSSVLSIKTVTISGGLLFIVFSVLTIL